MSDPQHSRRDFLKGRAAAGAIAAALEEHLGALEPAPLCETQGQYLKFARRAMACAFELRLNVDRQEAGQGSATEAALAALDVVERVEDRLTIYREESDVIDLNRRAARDVAEADEELFSLLELCDRLYHDTQGAFDPTSGPLSRVWGFHQREGKAPSEEELAEALKRVGWNQVELDREHQTVKFLGERMELNANSFGKGYALDRAGELLAKEGVTNSLMHGGRSTLLARGDDLWLKEGGWRVGLRDPLQPQLRLAELRLHNEALSTSGQGTQFFEQEGRKLGHVIDPRTGWPAEGLFSATVIAPTGAEADALSTALCVLGVEGAAELCKRRAELKALLVVPSETDGATVHALNLDEEEWRPSESV